jgi:GAF domain-containing protein
VCQSQSVQEEVGDQFAAVARELRTQRDEAALLDRAISIATELIAGCQHACVTLVHHAGRRLETPAFTSDVARRGDELQYEFDEGPCLDSVRHHETTASSDLRAERRWPRWAPAVVEQLGIRSMLCYQLFTSEHSYGALNLYSEQVNGFDEDDQAVGLALAAHVAVALAASREIDTRGLAIARRTIIGQAQGILMERYGIEAEQALRALTRVSQDSNRKLFDVAQDVVITRRAPRS